MNELENLFKETKHEEETAKVNEVEIKEDHNGDSVYIYHSDKRNYSVSTKTVNRKAVLLLSRHLDKEIKPSEIYNKGPREQEKLLNTALNNYDEALKFIFVPTDNGDVKVGAVTSTKHKQISKAKVARAMIEAAKDINLSPEDVQVADNRFFSFKVAKRDRFELWTTIDTGKNVPIGRSAIRFNSRFRFEGGYGGYVACHNWAYWEEAAAFLDISLDSLEIEQPTISGLSGKTLHLSNQEINKKEFKEAFEDVMEGVDEAEEALDDAVDLSLTRQEGQSILEAYYEALDLPDYITEQLTGQWTKHDGRTVGGLSQSISWIRTHGRVIKRKEWGGREKQLEKMAAEVIRLTPVIRKVKEMDALKKPVLLGEQKPEVVAAST